MPVGSWAHIAEVRVVGEIHGSRTQNVYHFGTDLTGFDAGFPPQPLVDLGTFMLECVRDTLLPAVSSDWKVVHIETQEIFPTLTDTVFTTALPTDVGARGATNVSFCSTQLNLRTGIGGRRARGKKFLPPPGDGDITASEIDDAVLLLLAAFLLCLAEKFMGSTPESNWHLGVLSRLDAGAILANMNSGFRVVASINPVANPAVMGSRKRLRGQ